MVEPACGVRARGEGPRTKNRAGSESEVQHVASRCRVHPPPPSDQQKPVSLQERMSTSQHVCKFGASNLGTASSDSVPRPKAASKSSTALACSCPRRPQCISGNQLLQGIAPQCSGASCYLKFKVAGTWTDTCLCVNTQWFVASQNCHRSLACTLGDRVDRCEASGPNGLCPSDVISSDDMMIFASGENIGRSRAHDGLAKTKSNAGQTMRTTPASVHK